MIGARPNHPSSRKESARLGNEDAPGGDLCGDRRPDLFDPR